MKGDVADIMVDPMEVTGTLGPEDEGSSQDHDGAVPIVTRRERRGIAVQVDTSVDGWEETAADGVRAAMSELGQTFDPDKPTAITDG